ncbi:hypothetical protein JCM19235_3475 [Vibrio maritimus]|uniref:Uncharacterized protein n=1 Tax=Vibrio maritimus TaxID=990268 RepID=A0A090S141_9VIBR|nr:hypothetical protein JCM19235_3475 [Vibrio maritimus]
MPNSGELLADTLFSYTVDTSKSTSSSEILQHHIYKHTRFNQ